MKEDKGHFDDAFTCTSSNFSSSISLDDIIKELQIPAKSASILVKGMVRILWVMDLEI